MRDDIKEFVSKYLTDHKDVDQSQFSLELHRAFPTLSMFDICTVRNYLTEELKNKVKE